MWGELIRKADAARELGCSRQHIDYLIRTRKLSTATRFSKTYVTVPSLKLLKQARQAIVTKLQ